MPAREFSTDVCLTQGELEENREKLEKVLTQFFAHALQESDNDVVTAWTPDNAGQKVFTEIGLRNEWAARLSWEINDLAATFLRYVKHVSTSFLNRSEGLPYKRPTDSSYPSNCTPFENEACAHWIMKRTTAGAEREYETFYEGFMEDPEFSALWPTEDSREIPTLSVQFRQNIEQLRDLPPVWWAFDEISPHYGERHKKEGSFQLDEIRREHKYWIRKKQEFLDAYRRQEVGAEEITVYEAKLTTIIAQAKADFESAKQSLREILRTKLNDLAALGEDPDSERVQEITEIATAMLQSHAESLAWNRVQDLFYTDLKSLFENYKLSPTDKLKEGFRKVQSGMQGLPIEPETLRITCMEELRHRYEELQLHLRAVCREIFLDRIVVANYIKADGSSAALSDSQKSEAADFVADQVESILAPWFKHMNAFDLAERRLAGVKFELKVFVGKLERELNPKTAMITWKPEDFRPDMIKEIEYKEPRRLGSRAVKAYWEWHFYRQQQAHYSSKLCDHKKIRLQGLKELAPQLTGQDLAVDNEAGLDVVVAYYQDYLLPEHLTALYEQGLLNYPELLHIVFERAGPKEMLPFCHTILKQARCASFMLHGASTLARAYCRAHNSDLVGQVELTDEWKAFILLNISQDLFETDGYEDWLSNKADELIQAVVNKSGAENQAALFELYRHRDKQALQTIIRRMVHGIGLDSSLVEGLAEQLKRFWAYRVKGLLTPQLTLESDVSCISMQDLKTTVLNFIHGILEDPDYRNLKGIGLLEAANLKKRQDLLTNRVISKYMAAVENVPNLIALREVQETANNLQAVTQALFRLLREHGGDGLAAPLAQLLGGQNVVPRVVGGMPRGLAAANMFNGAHLPRGRNDEDEGENLGLRDARMEQ